MTTLYSKEEKCAVCGKTSEYTVIGSTNAFGSHDLDTRPPEMMRSTIKLSIQRCPSCGYCAPDISQQIEKSSEVVHSDPYQQQLNNLEFPELANSFICFSIIQESAGEYESAGWDSIHAAWICDDNGYDEGAQKCRKKAVALLQKAKENGQSFGEQVGVEETIIVDLLRRSGQFESAMTICDDGLKKNPAKTISDILLFQKMLINKSDVACHKIAEAIRFADTYHMKYRVHRVEVNRDNMQKNLEQFLNRLDGDVLAVIPNVRPTFQLMGATSKVDFLLIVEKVK